jgi:hypothetical protein
MAAEATDLRWPSVISCDLIRGDVGCQAVLDLGGDGLLAAALAVHLVRQRRKVGPVAVGLGDLQGLVGHHRQPLEDVAVNVAPRSQR